MKKMIRILKGEAVLFLSAVLALVSMVLVPPDAGYAAYIDWRVLALLFCLMAVVGSIKEQGIFDRLCCALLNRAGDTLRVSLVLVLLPFFSSMLVTNDVALITFVPLAIGVLRICAKERMIFVVVMQTIAANLGSALTPFGNPQNLYLSSYYGFSFFDFLSIIFPAVTVGLVLIMASVLIGVRPNAVSISADESKFRPIRPVPLMASLGLFLLSVLSVLRMVNDLVTLLVVTAVLLGMERKSFRHVDVSLLATFILLFVFVGNIARIEAVRALLSQWIEGRTLLVSAIASQLISNVPAALMLSGFTQDGAGLLLGTNIGGLGTPIASMASLISLRLYSRSEDANTKRYLLKFSIFNFAFLALLLVFERFWG